MPTATNTPTQTAQADAEITKLRGELATLEQRRTALEAEIIEKWGADTQALELEAAQIAIRLTAGQSVLTKLAEKRTTAAQNDARTTFLRSQDAVQTAISQVDAAAAKVWKKWEAVMSEVQNFLTADSAWKNAWAQYLYNERQAENLGVPDLNEIRKGETHSSWPRDLDDVVKLARQLMPEE